MKIDRASRLNAKKYFRMCLRADGSLDEQKVREVVRAVTTTRPRNYLQVLTRLQRLVEMAIAERTVRIESATELPDQGAGVVRELESRFGPALQTHYTHNPTLLGGLRIQHGSRIWDGSLSTRLRRLEQAFS
jgi:F-type H+-transporting ATPase subunit delta